MTKKIDLILLDIDGVIYNFVEYTLPLFGRKSSEEIFIQDYDMCKSLGISQEEFWKKIDASEGVFCNGKNYFWSKQLIEICKKYSNKLVFCSNPGNNPKHWAEKRKWLEKNFLNIPLILTQHKEMLSLNGVVLIDDFSKNINKFNQAEGIGILFPQYWNELYSFRYDPVSYIDCTLDDITQIGFNKWKTIKKQVDY